MTNIWLDEKYIAYISIKNYLSAIFNKLVDEKYLSAHGYHYDLNDTTKTTSQKNLKSHKIYLIVW